jgi:elongation factor P--beta-lysine ligase
MGETEELIRYIYANIFPKPSRPTSIKKSKSLTSSGKKILTYQKQPIDLTPDWERISVVDAFKKHADMDLESTTELTEMKRIAQNKGYQVKNFTWEQLFHQIYLNEIEPKLGKNKPTIIYDFPSQMAMLAKKKKEDPRFSERFELYIGGLELGDCYSELTDWREQEIRFQEEIKKIREQGKTEYPYDQDFIQALKTGLPDCAGMAMGVDRLAMLFADAQNIDDVLYFPASQMW